MAPYGRSHAVRLRRVIARWDLMLLQGLHVRGAGRQGPRGLAPGPVPLAAPNLTAFPCARSRWVTCIEKEK